MSESDSFIDEVSEEVRRDRLYGLLRRYGWIGALVIVLVVGGAALNEWRKAQDRAEAEALGDALIAALEAPDDAARAGALADLAEAEGVAATPDAGAGMVVALMTAAAQLGGGAPDMAVETLTPLARSPDAPPAYSDLAALKLAMIGPPEVDAATRDQLLERLSEPGAPYRLLALEQQALVHAEAGRSEEAIDAAVALLQEGGVTGAMQQRLLQLILSLGGDLSRIASGAAENAAEALPEAGAEAGADADDAG